MSKRIAGDAYYTPQPLADAIVDRIKSRMPGTPLRVWEPHSGGGAFVRAARERWALSTIIALDVDVGGCANVANGCGANAFIHANWLDPLPHIKRLEAPPSLILGNPPFTAAESHVRLALDRALLGGVVAFLMRLSFTASGGRMKSGGICTGGPDGMGLHSVHRIAPRPCFVGGKSDNSEYALLVWVKGGTDGVIMDDPIIWEKPKVKRAPKTNADRIHEAMVALAALDLKAAKLRAKIAKWESKP